MNPLYYVRAASFAYEGASDAVHGLDLDIRGGEFILLLGANGSGKTTLLKILDGLLFPISGSVHFDGTQLTEAVLADPDFNCRFRRRVALLFQNPEVQLFCPTVADDVAFGPRQLGLEPTDVSRRVADSLRLLGIESLAVASVLDLSEGEKQRAALAAVLALNPDVLLLDEPLAALDPCGSRLALGLFAELKSAGKTLVVATHDLECFAALADRAVVMGEDGAALVVADAATVLQDRALLVAANLV
jgi:cobalt/nickel transport system ATP-binding protein